MKYKTTVILILRDIFSNYSDFNIYFFHECFGIYDFIITKDLFKKEEFRRYYTFIHAISDSDVYYIGYEI